jgi:hypothetical protein
MAQVRKSAQDFELFEGLNPATGRVSAQKNVKGKVILGRCAIFSPATPVVGVMCVQSLLKPSLSRCTNVPRGAVGYGRRN